MAHEKCCAVKDVERRCFKLNSANVYEEGLLQTAMQRSVFDRICVILLFWCPTYCSLSLPPSHGLFQILNAAIKSITFDLFFIKCLNKYQMDCKEIVSRPSRCLNNESYWLRHFYRITNLTKMCGTRGNEENTGTRY